ncbi:hypothetical protein HYH02_012381 [Chlamydomonas schloesseri]|uniref:Uncharacterized protein n=1 Tax=Chlamydomonas schloesseri TaxID=2026947 RepID=A0A835W391_9CHLO|nr:hypothetical protein HYH02_012381 [Chlamydomonas schloesseri]|eukprot:KAG2434366.1 hypothetical protein HYH02_012381 [Chlamydomonas schloesseri]
MVQVHEVIADLATEYERSRRFLSDLEESLKQRPAPPPLRADRIDEDADFQCPAAPADGGDGSDASSSSSDDEDDAELATEREETAAPTKAKSSKIASKLKSIFSRGSSQKPRPAASAAPASIGGGDVTARSGGARRPSIVNIGLHGGSCDPPTACGEDTSPCPRPSMLGRTTSLQQPHSSAAAGRGHTLLHHSTSSNAFPLRRSSLDLYSSSAAAQQAAAALVSGRVSMEGNCWGMPLSCNGGGGGGYGGGGGGPVEPAAAQYPARRVSGVLSRTSSLRAVPMHAAAGAAGADMLMAGTAGSDGHGHLPPLVSAASERRPHLLRLEEDGPGHGGSDLEEEQQEEQDDEEGGTGKPACAYPAQQSSPSQHAAAAGLHRASFTHRRPITSDGMGEMGAPAGAAFAAATSTLGALRTASSMRHNALLTGAGSASHRALMVAAASGAADEDGGSSSPHSGPHGAVVPAAWPADGASTARGGHTPLAGTRSCRTLQTCSQQQAQAQQLGSSGGSGPAPPPCAVAAMLHSQSMRARPGGSMPLSSGLLLFTSPSGALGTAPNSNRNSMSQQVAHLPDITTTSTPTSLQGGVAGAGAGLSAPGCGGSSSAALGRADSARRFSMGQYGACGAPLAHAVSSGLAHTSSGCFGGAGSQGGGGTAGAAGAAGPLRADSSRRLSSGHAALVPTGSSGFQGTMHLI